MSTDQTYPLPDPTPAPVVTEAPAAAPQPTEAPAAAPNVFQELETLDFAGTTADTSAPEAQIGRPRLESKQNIESTYDLRLGFPEGQKFNPDLETIPVPADYVQNIAKMVDDAPNIRLDGHTKGAEWSGALREGMVMSPMDNMFLGTLEDPEALWVQEVPSAKGPLRANTPALNNPGAEIVTGERGIITMLNYLGMGSVFRAPLWNSGFWVAIKAVPEGEILEMYRQVLADKIQLGRDSYGLALSNTSAFTAERLVDLSLQHLFSSSLVLDKDRDMLDMISVHDLYTLVWAMISAIYNTGFQYKRACSHDPTKCQHVEEERLNVTKLLWTNKRALTAFQISHMTNHGPNAMKADQVDRYRRDMLRAQPREFVVGQDNGTEVRFVFRVPSVRQHIQAGKSWVGSIASMVNGALGEEANLAQRNAYINQRGKATSMRQYMHWVESITTNEKTVLATDTNTFETLFDRLSANDKVREKFIELVLQYIQDTTITVLGIPDYVCPACGNDQAPPHTAAGGTHILPLDMYQTFFTLVVQRIQRIGERY